MKKILFILCLLIGFSFMAGAMPNSYATNSTGWMAISIGLSFWLPNLTPNLIFEAEYAAPPGFGIGATIIAGFHTSMTIDGLYYVDPLPGSNFAIPIKLHVGFFENDFGASMSAGIKYYAVPFFEDTYNMADACVNVEATVNWIKNRFVFGVNAFPGATINIK